MKLPPLLLPLTHYLGIPVCRTHWYLAPPPLWTEEESSEEETEEESHQEESDEDDIDVQDVFRPMVYTGWGSGF